MESTQAVPVYLFRAAALLNAVSVPGHIVFGWKTLDPLLHVSSPKHALGAASARVGWNHMTVGIFAAAALNWHWSNVGGPQELHEKAIFWALLAGGWYVGWEYWVFKEYRPLMCLWVAPLLGFIGMALVR